MANKVVFIPGPEGGYILTASWTMNKAFGVVHREHWALEADGCARLVSDDFEVQGERQSYSEKLEARSQKLEARSQKLEARSQKLEARSQKLEARTAA